MPTIYMWTGSISTDATNPANWLAGPEQGQLPGSDDQLVFVGQLNPMPGMPPSSANCVGLSGTFDAITIQSSYAATVTFGGAVTVNNYEQAGGAISQPNSTYELTANNFFTWTGGTLNSSATASTVNIAGATATIAPGVGNTITTGSTLRFEDRSTTGSNATVTAGTITLANSATEDVELLSAVLVDTTVGNAIFLNAAPPADPKPFTVDGKWTVEGGKTSDVPTSMFVKGTLTIRQGSTLSVETVSKPVLYGQSVRV